ncbi:hypothetical protein HBI24_175770 [Parastagonospora nodorum]|nr:hypothetical protein HBH54_242980 [Parastagonospora nodorum]KAH3939050.1 hypothetical protein HBH53_240910 [Parastagonospora nodorum]KAH4012748.1 hypothetical protein HBI09_220160 [Parastagonospora nodorum]KAH4123831.1 hypothetical protein HBH45_242330 [Parastagonospora nodorum]KAH4954701.1 hypothetical protein HBI78_220310 [Parastagonospora nodorum]
MVGSIIVLQSSDAIIEEPAYADFHARIRFQPKEVKVDMRREACRFVATHDCAAASEIVLKCLPSPHTYSAIGLETAQLAVYPLRSAEIPFSLCATRH